MQGAFSDCYFKDGEMDGGGGITCVLALLGAVTVVGPLTL